MQQKYIDTKESEVSRELHMANLKLFYSLLFRELSEMWFLGNKFKAVIFDLYSITLKCKFTVL